MATRSLIGIKLGDYIKTIYCHWDGYPEYNGQLLVNNYNTPTAVFDLLDLGDLSTLAETPASSTAYHRDRKDPWEMVESRDVDTSELMNVAKDYDAEYVYIYNDENEWDCYRIEHTQIDILSGKVALN